LKIILLSIGTRGDIEPFIAIGEELYKRGHTVLLSFPAQHAKWVPKSLPFVPLSPKFIELIESDAGKTIMGGQAGWYAKVKALYTLYKEGKSINQILVRQQYELLKNENPDIVIHNLKCSYPLVWSIKTSKKSVMISPVPNVIHYNKDMAHVGFNGDYGQLINRLTYSLANFGLMKTIKDASKMLPKEMAVNRGEIIKAIHDGPLIFTISQALFSRPKYWPSHIKVLGYHAQEKTDKNYINNELEAFLDRHEKPLFLTFGSMVCQHPERISKVVLETLSKLKIPTVINTASGGILKLKEFEAITLFYFVESIPYEWILKRVYAVVHHGGSGTTHLGLQYGCATLIIPHIIDQYDWNCLIQDIGAGPKGPSIKKLCMQNLEPLLIDLMTNDFYKSKAKRMARQMKNEDLKEELYQYILA